MWKRKRSSIVPRLKKIFEASPLSRPLHRQVWNQTKPEKEETAARRSFGAFLLFPEAIKGRHIRIPAVHSVQLIQTIYDKKQNPQFDEGFFVFIWFNYLCKHRTCDL